MKILLLALLLTSCSFTFELESPVVPTPEPKKPKIHNVGECFEFIKASKDSWGQPQVIVKILKVGIENYLVTVVENPRRHTDIVIAFDHIEHKEPIPCH